MSSSAMKFMSLEFLSCVRPLVPYSLRAAIGWGQFAMHGLPKFHTNGSWDWAHRWGHSGSNTALLYAVAWTELVVGICLMLGFFTRWSAVVVILGLGLYCGLRAVRGHSYVGCELGVAYMAASIALLHVGPGRWSVDHLLWGNGRAA